MKVTAPGVNMTAAKPVRLGESVGRASAFRRLADQHLDEAYRLATAILHDEADAQDATHDAFERAWRKWSTLRDESRFDAWFGRILVNECRDRLRHGRRWRLVSRLGGCPDDMWVPARA